MSEDVKATARWFLAEQDRLRGQLTSEHCSDDYLFYFGTFPPMDLEAHKGLATAFWEAFPDLHQVVEEVIAEGNTAVVRFRARGANTGSLMGMPPSGKAIDVGGFALMRIRDGKVTEMREEMDQMGLMQQIGALPGH